MRYVGVAGLRLTADFALAEFLPHLHDPLLVPPEVPPRLTQLAKQVLQPVRDQMRLPVHILSGWRSVEYNRVIGGSETSDHLDGNAADFYVAAGRGAPWEENTRTAFDWIRLNLPFEFGQLILEDHRRHFGVPGKLWLHVSNPTPRHPARAENAVLASLSPHHYERFA